uniref:Uncharacterized protein n=1 Tax=viral metagenome TaxID=1070528 RepID=A0A6M3LG37_9ZZZZ
MSEHSIVMRPVGQVCAGKKRDGSGGLCKKPAGWGTDHVGFGRCKLHAGSVPSACKAAERERALWEQFLIDEIDPSLKVIRQLRDGGEVLPRDRIRAASWLVEQARTLLEGSGGKFELKIQWPE